MDHGTRSSAIQSRLRELLKSATYGVFSSAHLEFLVARRGTGFVLNLHRVHPDASPFWPPIHPDHLDWLIGRLKRVGHFVDIRELASTPVPTTERVFVLSFDDGYSDFLQHALPVIESHGVPSNLNIVAESTSTGLPIWSARLYDALSRLEVANLDSIAGLLPDARNLTHSNSPEHVGFAISNHIRQLPTSERFVVIKRIEEAGRPNLDPVRALTVEQITALPESVHIGAHGGTHEPMTHASISEFDCDFETCRDLFENHLRKPLVTYAFPLGGYRAEQLDYLQAAGIEQILLVGERTTKGGENIIPRLTIGGRLRGQFIAKSVGVSSRRGNV